MADGWDNIIIGMKVFAEINTFVARFFLTIALLDIFFPKVEVENSDADPIPGVFSTSFWVATVLRIQGYKVSSFFTNPSFLFNLSLEMNELEVVVGVCDGSPQGLDSDPASATSDRFRSFAPFSS